MRRQCALLLKTALLTATGSPPPSTLPTPRASHPPCCRPPAPSSSAAPSSAAAAAAPGALAGGKRRRVTTLRVDSDSEHEIVYVAPLALPAALPAAHPASSCLSHPLRPTCLSPCAPQYSLSLCATPAVTWCVLPWAHPAHCRCRRCAPGYQRFAPCARCGRSQRCLRGRWLLWTPL